jgi:hypothetical protein
MLRWCIVLLVFFILPSALSSQAPVAAETYVGRVLSGDGQTPVAGASVVLFTDACAPDQKHSDHLVQTTSADGTYRFANVASQYATLLVYQSGFSGDWRPCRQFQTESVSLPDIKLYPVFSASQMKDDALVPAYGELRNYVTFRAANFSSDGRSFNFVTLDGYAHKGPEEAWTYDLSEQSLKQRALPQNWEADEFSGTADPHDVDAERMCRGCAFTLTANLPVGSSGAKTTSNVITRNLSSGYIESSDRSAVFWGEMNSKGQFIIGIFEFANGSKRYVIPPWPNVVTLLAAHPEGGGYVVAYSAEFGCDPPLEQRIEWLKQPYPENQFAWHSPWHVCFVSIP